MMFDKQGDRQSQRRDSRGQNIAVKVIKQFQEEKQRQGDIL